jgi:hypothetical protein
LDFDGQRDHFCRNVIGDMIKVVDIEGLADVIAGEVFNCGSRPILWSARDPIPSVVGTATTAQKTTIPGLQ